jgi:hypothetical protein
LCQILVVDTLTGKVLDTKDVSNHLKNMRPYREWLRDHAIRLKADPQLEEQLSDQGLTGDALKAAQKMFMVTFEERDQLLRPIAESGQEAVVQGISHKHCQLIQRADGYGYSYLLNPKDSNLKGAGIGCALHTALSHLGLKAKVSRATA